MNRIINIFFIIILLSIIPVQAEVYINIPKYKYIINYYIDEISDNSYIGTIEGSEYLNRKIDIDFNYLLPGGYTYTGKINYYIIKDNMVINVIYSKKTNLSYCVNYFYDGIISVNDTICYYNQTHGTKIDFFIDKPKEGYVYYGFEPIIVLDIEENIMNVYYKKDDKYNNSYSNLVSFIFEYGLNLVNKFIKLISFIE